MSIKNYKDLIAWQKSIQLVKLIYQSTESFPKPEIYGLTSQIRKSAVSIPSNIAEGSARKATKDYIRFLNIAYGSLAELETQAIIAYELKYLDDITNKKIISATQEIAKILSGLISKLESKLDH